MMTESYLNPGQIYIPICFYLNWQSRRIGSSRDLIYIPICFYLNDPKSNFYRFFGNIYIPICFYLNSDILLCESGKCHLHSNMLLFKFDKIPGFDFFNLIYIPICFYLNLCKMRYLSPDYQHLHSNMLLLKWFEIPFILASFWYLHSNMLLLKLV